VEVRGPGELEHAFASMAQERVGAVVVLADPMLGAHRTRSQRRRRRDLLNRPAGKGIVGYPTRLKPLYPPLQFVGKDHSQRPEASTKRIGRKRGPGGGGRSAAALAKALGGSA